MVPNPTYPEEMIPSILILKLKHQKKYFECWTKWQRQRGKDLVEMSHQQIERRGEWAGSFSLACDRAGWSTGTEGSAFKSNLKNSDSTISVSLTGFSPLWGIHKKLNHSIKCLLSVSIHSLFKSDHGMCHAHLFYSQSRSSSGVMFVFLSKDNPLTRPFFKVRGGRELFWERRTFGTFLRDFRTFVDFESESP